MTQENIEYPETLSYQTWLQQEYVNRCRKNPSYSLRAFARLLNTDSSSLSQILSGKRNASPKLVARFADAIGVEPKLREAVISDAQRKMVRRSTAMSSSSFHQLSADIFSVIADWYHYAILELIKLNNFQADPRWVALQLDITTVEARIAIERLLRLELIKEENGYLSVVQQQVTNDGSVATSSAMKQLQRSLLEKALAAIDEIPQGRKDITSMTMAIDESKLPEARKRIKDFRRSLCAYLESDQPTAVFNLGIQLYPLTLKGTE